MALLLFMLSIPGVAEDAEVANAHDPCLLRGMLVLQELGVQMETASPEQTGALTDPTLPLVFRQAFEAGTLVAIKDNDARWVSCVTPRGAKHFDLLRPRAVLQLTDSLLAKNYRSYESPSVPQWVLLAPWSEFGDDFSPEVGYQDAWMEGLLAYNESWLANDLEATHLEQDSVTLEAAVSDKTQALAASESIERERVTRRDDLQREISALDAELRSIVELATPSTAASAEALGRFVYSKDKDYFAPVVAEQMVPLAPEIPVLGGDAGVTFPFVQKEVNDALKSFYENLSESDLTQLGIPSKADLKLVSAARTPLKQCEVRKQNKVAIGMFDTGHAFGVSFDMQFRGMPFDVKSDFDNGTTPAHLAALIRVGGEPSEPVVREALARYKSDPRGYQKAFEAKMKAWSHLNALLAKQGFKNAGPKDANHYNLKAFVANKNHYGTRVRIKMLKAYNEKMISERGRQLAEADAHRKRKQAAQDRCIALDEAIRVVGGRVEKLEAEIKQLESTAADRRRQRDQRNRDREERRRQSEREHTHPRRGDADSDSPPEPRGPGSSGGGEPPAPYEPPVIRSPADRERDPPHEPEPPVIIWTFMPTEVVGSEDNIAAASRQVMTSRSQPLDRRFLVLRAVNGKFGE